MEVWGKGRRMLRTVSAPGTGATVIQRSTVWQEGLIQVLQKWGKEGAEEVLTRIFQAFRDCKQPLRRAFENGKSGSITCILSMAYYT